MTKFISALAAGLVGLTALSAPAFAADEGDLVEALPVCNASFFKAVAQNKQIPEALKVRDGDMAYFKIKNHPLDVIKFDRPIKQHGLTITGAIFNDEIVRYFGMPDMHSHFWGLTVKENFETTLTKLKKDWADLDMNHHRANLQIMSRKNGDAEWKPFNRPEERAVPEFGVSEKFFGVTPYGDETVIFCTMQSAGGPENAILKDTRPDLLHGEQHVSVTVPLDDRNRPHVDVDGKNIETGEVNAPEEEKAAAKAAEAAAGAKK